MLLIPAHAKINLCLAVMGARPDGFHEIDSVMVTIDWHDLIGVSAAAAAQAATRLYVTGTEAVAGDEDNLAHRAADAFTAWWGPATVDVWLDKRVPSRAGLGGGSADAAAVLRACAALLGVTEPDRARIAGPLASSLGSDVPAVLAGGWVRARGRGEQVTPLVGPSLHLAVAVAGESSTAATYAAAAPADHEDATRIEAVVAALARGHVPNDLLGSGLEGPACRVTPALGSRLAALRDATPGSPWHLTGSGGAAFAVASDRAAAMHLVAAAKGLGIRARACRTVC